MSSRHHVRNAPAPGARRRRAALAVVASGAGLLAATAHAGDQKLTGSISEMVIGDTNYQLNPGDSGTLGSDTTLNLIYQNLGPAEELNLRGGMRYSAYTGDQNNNLAGLFPNLSGNFRRERSDRALTFDFSGSVAPVQLNSTSFVLLPTDPDADPDAPPQIGVVSANDETLRASLLVGVGYEYQVNSTESLLFGVSARRIDYLDDTAGQYSASSTIDFDAGWSHQISSTWDAGLKSGITTIVTDDSSDRNTVTVFVAPSLGYARTPNQTLDVSLGPSISFLSGGQRASETQMGIRAAIGALYVDGPNTFNASLSNNTQPSDEGVASNVTSLRMSLGRRIDATQSLLASVGASLQTPLGGDNAAGGNAAGDSTTFNVRGSYTVEVNSLTTGQAGIGAAYSDDNSGTETVYSANATLSYLLTEETTAKFGYVFRVDESASDTMSHRVTFTLRRNFTILP